MHRFFAAGAAEVGQSVQLSENESAHAARVLRLAPGATVEITDPDSGSRFLATLSDVQSACVTAVLTEAIAADPENRHLQRQMQRLFLTKISTVHGFCGDLLREFAYKLDLSADFRVADENECSEMRETVLSDLLDRAYESAGENGDFRAFVDTQGLGRTDKLVSEIVLKVYDSARCHLNPEK